MRQALGGGAERDQRTAPFAALPSAGEEVSERALVAALKAGSETAFETILKRYELKVFNLTRGLLRNDDDAQDATRRPGA